MHAHKITQTSRKKQCRIRKQRFTLCGQGYDFESSSTDGEDFLLGDLLEPKKLSSNLIYGIYKFKFTGRKKTFLLNEKQKTLVNSKNA